MKWMLSTMIMLAVSSAAAAQSGTEMRKPAMGDTMKATYTGCVESINHGRTFMLTHIDPDRMGAMHDGVAMNKDDAMMKHDEHQAMDDTHDMHSMAPSAFVLTGSSDLKKHVGHKVSVTGSLAKNPAETMRNDPEAFSVSSLKVVAKSCS